MKKIAVIGAGMAGTGAAWYLRKAGHAVSIFEKDDFPGGRAYTHRGDGFSVNTGAGFYTNFYPLLREIVKELGLDKEVVENPKAVTLATPEQHYTYQLDSVLSFFRIPFLSLREKLRLLRLTLGLTLKKRRHDLVNPDMLARHDGFSIAAFARKRLGENGYQYLVRSAIEPYWYFSCEQASAALMKALQAEAASARFFTLRSGIDRIATSMLQGQDLHLSTPVRGIQVDTEQVRLQFPEGPDRSFDAVVLATTASAAQRLTADLPKDTLSLATQAYLRDQRYAANINAYFMVPNAVLGDFSPQTSPVGPETHGVAAIALHGSQVDPTRYPDHRLLGIWLNDALSRTWLGRPEAEVAEDLWQLIRRYYPDFPAETPPLGHLTRRAEAIPIPEPGRYIHAAQVWTEQRPPLVLAGDYLSTATMEGALHSGQRAAQILMDAWKN